MLTPRCYLAYTQLRGLSIAPNCAKECYLKFSVLGGGRDLGKAIVMFRPMRIVSEGLLHANIEGGVPQSFE